MLLFLCISAELITNVHDNVTKLSAAQLFMRYASYTQHATYTLNIISTLNIILKRINALLCCTFPVSQFLVLLKRKKPETTRTLTEISKKNNTTEFCPFWDRTTIWTIGGGFSSAFQNRKCKRIHYYQ